MLEHKDRLVPIYVFYNSDALLKSPLFPSYRYWRHYPFCYFGLAAWGISAASALSVKQANWGKNNKPDDFCVVPWHCLVCEECWDVTATGKSLPEMVRRGLKALFEAATDLREYKKSFELTGKPPKWVGLLTDGDDDRLRGKPPNWVRLLTDGDDDRESLTSEMREYGLRGVAVLAQTDERLD